MSIIDDVLQTFEGNPGASETAIASFEAVFGFKPPAGYLEFMRRCNGGEGPVGKRYLMLWSLEELRQCNEDYRVKVFAPGLFLFGSSGGGEAYAFDIQQPAPGIVSVPFVGISLKEARGPSRTFDEFLQSLAHHNGT
jgi:hypothetical protein